MEAQDKLSIRLKFNHLKHNWSMVLGIMYKYGENTPSRNTLLLQAMAIEKQMVVMVIKNKWLDD